MKGSIPSDEVDLHLGRQLRLLRVQQGLSQTDLGQLLGVSYQQIQKYEAGSNQIAPARLVHVCAHFGVPISYFFESAPGMPAAGSLRAPPAVELPRGAESLASLDPAILKQLLKLADAIVRRDD